MKSPDLDKTAVTIDGGEALETESFGIANIAKAIHAITTTLYKNPAWSVLAEISANAYDAHVAAGTQDKPFIVTLPSYLQPTFSVRDFGTSMSHNFMMDTKRGYCGLFYSSKSDDNEQNGSFGIGRLTILALGDTYTAICYKEGKKRIYTVVKENCIPNITFCGEFETDEPDGFEVSVDVDTEHIYAFKDSAEKIFQYYKVKPVIKGQDITIPDITYTVKGPDWGITLGEEPMAVMGVYAYPIETKYFTGLSDFEDSLITSGLILNFNLGDLSVNLSRNGLFYDKRTKQAIIDKLASIRVNLAQQIQTDFDAKCTSSIDAYKLYYQYFCSNGDLYKLGKYLGEKFQVTHKGKTISDWKMSIAKDDVETKIRNYSIRYRRGGTSVTFYETDFIPVYESELTYIFLNDLPGNKATRRIRFFLKEKHFNCAQNYQVFLLTPSNKFLQEHDLQRANFIPVSSLPQPTKEAIDRIYNYNPKSRLKIFQLVDSNKYPSSSKDWEDVDEDFDIEENDPNNPRVYAEIDRYKILNGNYNLFRGSQLFGFTLPEFYGIRCTATEIIDEVRKAGWISIAEYIAKKISEFRASPRHNELLTHYREYEVYNCKYDCSHSIYKKVIPNSYAVRNYKNIEKPEHLYDDFSFVNSHSNWFDFDAIPRYDDRIKQIQALPSLHNTIITEYPLLDDLNYYGSNKSLEPLIKHYVDSIDKINGRDIEENPENI